MTSACTILCPTIDFQKVWQAVRSASDGEVSLDGTSENWSRITCQHVDKRLTLTSLVRGQPGDKFSKLILSMHNYFRRIETDVELNKKYILDRIVNVKMMIGVVGEPEFLQDDDRLNILWAIAESMDALIFNGDAMLDMQGGRILDQDGRFDVLV